MSNGRQAALHVGHHRALLWKARCSDGFAGPKRRKNKAAQIAGRGEGVSKWRLNGRRRANISRGGGGVVTHLEARAAPTETKQRRRAPRPEEMKPEAPRDATAPAPTRPEPGFGGRPPFDTWPRFHQTRTMASRHAGLSLSEKYPRKASAATL